MMIKTLLKQTLSALAIFFALTAIAVAQNWSGDWDSNFGQLRLLQNGDRLHGDYQERGVIEGRISADGRTARAVFLYNDGRWGYVQWRIANDKLAGTWNWAADGIPDPKSGKSWTATRTSQRTSPLKYSSQTLRKMPNDSAISQPAFTNWFEFAGQPSPRPAPQPQAGARDGLSDWYLGFTLVNTQPGFAIEADVTHFRGANTAAVDISIFVDRSAACPDTLHIDFCEELRARADQRGYVDVRTTGVSVVNIGSGIGEAVQAQFRLPGDRADRMLVIGREATYFRASIMHPSRGYDYSGFADTRGHICDQSQCLDDIFVELRNNPSVYYGSYSRGAATLMINSPNNITRSHAQIACCAPTPQPQPQPAPGPRPLISDAYAILEETNENVGEISFSPDGNRLAASGKLRNFFETGEDHDTVFTLASQTDEAIAFDLTVYAGQSGESKQGRLMVELPSFAAANPRGTLIVGDEVLLIELLRPTPGLQPNEVHDTPAIGVFGVSYRLRDVPLNRSLQLRQNATRSSAIVGGISPSSTGLQVLSCVPQIDSLAFQEASFDGRLALLSSSWCQVTNNQIAGWTPGRYLVPEAN